MELLPFVAAEDVGDRFLALLSAEGIKPPSKSEVENQLLSLTELVSIAKDPRRAESKNYGDLIRTAAGVHDLAAKILSCSDILEFNEFRDHLRLIADGISPTYGTITQNTASDIRDDVARKIAELYVACLVAQFGLNVRLDHPTNSLGDNPDIVFDLKLNRKPKGQEPIYEEETWTIAIKTISSRHGQTIFENVKKAAEQIKSPKCCANHGLILINVKNVLPHDCLWEKRYSSLEESQCDLLNEIRLLTDAAKEERSATEWRNLFDNKVVLPIIFLGQTAVSLPETQDEECSSKAIDSDFRVPTSLKMMNIFDPLEESNSVCPTAKFVAERMNHYMQTILYGCAGTEQSQPR